MGMSNYILDHEEMFFGGAQDIVHECESFEQFEEIMMKQKDLVVHMSNQDIVDVLGEIWSEFWSENV